jgi:hypothetical protein
MAKAINTSPAMQIIGQKADLCQQAASSSGKQPQRAGSYS